MPRTKTIIIIKGRRQRPKQQRQKKHERSHAPDCTGWHCEYPGCTQCLNKNYYHKTSGRFVGRKYCWKCIRKLQ